MKEAIFYCIVGLPLFGQEGSGTPVFKILVRALASKVGISSGTVQSILNNILGMSNVSARWMPRVLTDDQKRTLLDISRYLLSCYEDDPGDFIEQVVSQDKTWVHH